MTRVRIEDCRAIRYCVPGVKRWCGNNGLDFREFVRNGVDADQLPHDDAMIDALIEQARRREVENGIE